MRGLLKFALSLLLVIGVAGLVEAYYYYQTCDAGEWKTNPLYPASGPVKSEITSDVDNGEHAVHHVSAMNDYSNDVFVHDVNLLHEEYDVEYGGTGSTPVVIPEGGGEWYIYVGNAGEGKSTFELTHDGSE